MDIANKYIWVVGASSGIGRELAIELHSKDANLILSARNEVQLNTLNKQLDNKHQVLPVDVSDVNALKQAISKINKLDSLVFMAAIYKPAKIAGMDIDFVKNIMDINLLGAIYTSCLVLPKLKQQSYGQIALCGSVAGYTGLPNGQPYSATKAGVINFAQSLYAEHPELDIKVINPGFVRTRMTDKNKFKMPMRIEPQQAAKSIARGLTKRGFEIHFPKAFTYILKLISILPYWLKLKITKRLSN